jgi:predicted outer membrane protein
MTRTLPDSAFDVSAGRTRIEAFMRPYAVLIGCMMIGAAGFVMAGLAADDPPPGAPIALTIMPASDVDAEQAFAQKAAEGGATQVALAELALLKGRSETVKRAAARIQADHVRTNQMLLVLAAQKGWHLPSTPGSEGEESRSRLEKLSGAAFDRAYLEAAMRDHESDIPAFEQEAAHGSDADLKRFAADTLPALREHLALVMERQAMAMNASP